MAISISSGGMSEMAPWLDRKYANQEEETAIRGAEVASKAGLYGAQAEQASAEANVGIPALAGLRRAEGARSLAEANVGVPAQAAAQHTAARRTRYGPHPDCP